MGHQAGSRDCWIGFGNLTDDCFQQKRILEQHIQETRRAAFLMHPLRLHKLSTKVSRASFVRRRRIFEMWIFET